jgi:predicted MFS family arabinose efflux permease
MFNPFLPIFAAGLNTNVIVMGRLVGLRNVVGLASPIFGTLADRKGFRLVMSTALLVIAAGLTLVGSSFGVLQAAAGMILIGLGIAAFVPTLQAYLGAHLPYDQLARGTGILEYSWALTGIVGLSLMGLLIAATNWRAPFFVLSAGLVVAFFVFRTLPSARDDGEHTLAPSVHRSSSGIWARLGEVFAIKANRASAYANIVASGLIYYGGMQLAIVHGVWFADQYGFDARQLGLVALVFGFFDLAGSVSVSLFTDRFGKRRSVILGAIGSLIVYLLIPWLNIAVIAAVAAAALSRTFFEFAIVSNISLLSGQSPNERAKVMTVSAVAALGCSTIATFTAPSIYEHSGIAGVTLISAACSAVALILLFAYVRENLQIVTIQNVV